MALSQVWGWVATASPEPRQGCSEHWGCRVLGTGQSVHSVRAGWRVHTNAKVMQFPSSVFIWPIPGMIHAPLEWLGMAVQV